MNLVQSYTSSSPCHQIVKSFTRSGLPPTNRHHHAGSSSKSTRGTAVAAAAERKARTKRQVFAESCMQAELAYSQSPLTRTLLRQLSACTKANEVPVCCACAACIRARMAWQAGGLTLARRATAAGMAFPVIAPKMLGGWFSCSISRSTTSQYLYRQYLSIQAFILLPNRARLTFHKMMRIFFLMPLRYLFAYILVAPKERKKRLF